ncbi:MAG: LON peptidase substrate-binding domain-containing protein [Gemmatimonadales bacterium]
MSRRVPLFPLDAVLYPGTRLPLHIFEPRYRAMLTEVLAGDRTFALLPPTADDADPATGSIGCLAQVVSHQELPDGRANILVEGTQRCILRRIEETDHPFRVGLCDTFEDAEGSSEFPADLTIRLRALGERCRAAMAILAELRDGTEWSEAPGPLTFEIAATIPWEAAEGRALLAMRTPAERAAVLMAVLPGIVPDLERRSRVHDRAHTNGHGPGHG